MSSSYQKVQEIITEVEALKKQHSIHGMMLDKILKLVKELLKHF